MSTIKISYSKYVIDLLYNCYLSERPTAYLFAAHDAGIWKKGPVSSTGMTSIVNVLYLFYCLMKRLNNHAWIWITKGLMND